MGRHRLLGEGGAGVGRGAQRACRAAGRPRVELCGHTPLRLCSSPGPGQCRDQALACPVALPAVLGHGRSSVVAKVPFDGKADSGEAVPAWGQEADGKAACPPPNSAVSPALL